MSVVVSVVMPAYNAGRFIAEAVKSVLDQTFTQFELLVLDDGSSDNTGAIMAEIRDPRLRYVPYNQNRGLVAVLNDGLALATGPLIARMDADDVMRRDRLEKQVEFLMRNPDIAAVASFVDLINADGEPSGHWGTDRATPDEASIYAMLPRTNPLAHGTMMIRRSALQGMRYAGVHEDWNLWMRMAARGKRIAKIPEPLVALRVHPTSYMAGHRRARTLEHRLLHSRREYLVAEWRSGRFDTFQLRVIIAQWRTRTGLLVKKQLPALARAIHRLCRYSPLKLLAEDRLLNKAIAGWRGHHAFVFPYLNTGGAEQVHADIMASVADQSPIIFITGFSKDRTFAQPYASLGTLVEIPRLLHHPLTAKRARLRIVDALNARNKPCLFGSNTNELIEWGEQLRPDGSIFLLVHAFLYQPEGNRIHREWLRLFPRMCRYIFVAKQAMQEYAQFLQAKHIPKALQGKLLHIPNAVHAFGDVQPHRVPGVLFVGRDSPEKRLDLFMRIAHEMDRAAPGAFRFTVMGARPHGQSPVRFTGVVANPAERDRIYAEHDVLALTSSREGFPMAIMEAMAQGLAVLSTPVGDVPNRMDPGFSHITSSTGPDVVVREMCAALTALAKDPDRLFAMRQAALAAAHEQFSMQRFLARYRELLMTPCLDSSATSPSTKAGHVK